MSYRESAGDNILLGAFIPTGSPIHSLGAGVKLICLVMILPAIFLSRYLESILITSFFLLFVSYLTGIGIREWVYNIARFRWMLLITFLINYLFRSTGLIDPHALWTSLILAFHILAAIIGALCLTFTTTPWDLCRGVTSLGKPFRQLSIPVEDLGLTMAMAIRFTPMLHLELINIITAQRARGIDWKELGFMERAASLKSIIAPAINGAFRRADSLSVAIRARAYPPAGPDPDPWIDLSVKDVIGLVASVLPLLSSLSIYLLR
jgi:energy-coupling factor transport system permease protein